MCNPAVDDLSMMTYLSRFPNAKLKTGAPAVEKVSAARCKAYGPGQWHDRIEICQYGNLEQVCILRLLRTEYVVRMRWKNASFARIIGADDGGGL